MCACVCACMFGYLRKNLISVMSLDATLIYHVYGYPYSGSPYGHWMSRATTSRWFSSQSANAGRCLHERSGRTRELDRGTRTSQSGCCSDDRSSQSCRPATGELGPKKSGPSHSPRHRILGDARLSVSPRLASLQPSVSKNIERIQLFPCITTSNKKQ